MKFIFKKTGKLLLFTYIVLFPTITINSQNNNMPMSQYQKETDALNKAKEIVVKSNKTIDEKIIKVNLPELLTPEIVEKRLEIFQNSFYINNSKYNSFGDIELCYSTFKPIPINSGNMGVGFRWLEVMTKDGKNIIEPSIIEERDNVRDFHVKHNNGITDDMSLFGLDIAIIDADGAELDYVRGEAIVSFKPCYRKMEINPTDIHTIKTLNEIECQTDAFNNSYVCLNFKYETSEKFTLVGYNKNGDALDYDDYCITYLYENGKTALDFSEETLPEDDKVEREVFHVLFKGEVEKIELFWEDKREEHVVPIKTIADHTINLKIDDFKTINDGPSNEPYAHMAYENTTTDQLKKHTTVSFDRSEALMEFNKPELKVHLPGIANSNNAESYFKNLQLKKTANSKYVPLKWYTRINGVIDSFNEIETDEDGYEKKKEVKLMPGETSVRGEVDVHYPTQIEWCYANPETTSLHNDTHKVIIEGGLVTYYPPKGYNMFDLGWGGADHIIRAYNKDGRSLLLCEKESSVNDDDQRVIKFAYWGTIDHIEIAIVKKWETYSQYFEALVVPELTKNEQADNFFETMAEAMLGKEGVEEVKKEMAKEAIDENGEEKPAEIPLTEYKVVLTANTKQHKNTPFMWHGMLPGDNVFAPSHTTRLLQEALNMSEYALETIKSKFRQDELQISFYQVDESEIKKELTETELLTLLMKNAKSDSLTAALENNKLKWITPEPKAEFEPLSGFSKRKIIFEEFTAKIIDRYENEGKDFEIKKWKEIYEIYLENYDRQQAEVVEAIGEMVAYILEANTTYTIPDAAAEEVGDEMYPFCKLLGDLTDFSGINMRILEILFNPKIHDKIWLELMENVSWAVFRADDPIDYSFIAVHIEQASTLEQTIEFSFSIREAFRSNAKFTSSVHKWLAFKDFKTVFNLLESNSEKEDYLKTLLYNNLLPYEENTDAIMRFLCSQNASNYVRGMSIRAFVLVAEHRKQNFNDEMKKLALLQKSGNSSFWAAKVLMAHKPDEFREFTYDLMKKYMNKECKIDEEDIKWLKNNYNEKQAMQIIKQATLEVK